MIDSA
jgi:hypothetical protein